MRVGAMVVGILFAIWTFFEALLVGGLSGAADDEDMGAAAGGGLLASIIVGVAAALVLAVPLASAILFAFAGLVSFAAAGGGYENHWLYGSIFLGLAIMAFFGWRGKVRDRREAAAERQRQQQRDNRLASLVRNQTTAPGTPLSPSTVSNHWLLADLDSKARIALFQTIPANEDIRFVVRGSNGTLVGTEGSVATLPNRGRVEPIITAYADVSSPRIEPSRNGGRLLFEVNGLRRVIDLEGNAQLEQAMAAVQELQARGAIDRRRLPANDEDHAISDEVWDDAKVQEVEFAPVEVPKPSTNTFCTSCGAEFEGDERFCAMCGTARRGA